jgi:hypothetical protein
MSDNSGESGFKWIVGTVIALLGAGGGIVALLNYFNLQTTTNPLPTIPDADSGWVDGGSNPHAFCDPHLKALQEKYQDFSITMTVLPEQHRSEYNPFKHDVYRYMCSFTASRK